MIALAQLHRFGASLAVAGGVFAALAMTQGPAPQAVAASDMPETMDLDKLRAIENEMRSGRTVVLERRDGEIVMVASRPSQPTGILAQLP